MEVAAIRLITNLYWEHRAVVKVDNDKSEWMKIERGV